MVFLHFGERSGRVGEDCRGGRSDANNDIEKDVHQCVFCSSQQNEDILYRKTCLPDMPRKMLTSSETQVAWWIFGAEESLRLSLLLR